MKYLVLIYFIVLLSWQATAQKQYNVWYFGNKAGLSFNTSPPQALTDGVLNSYESSSGICDTNGNLLFYTNGDIIYNRAHQIMKNGTLNPFKRYSSMQGSLALPVPNSKNLYYIFTTQANEYGDTNQYLRYTIIDMAGDSTMGEVVTKDIPLFPNPGEGIAITKHANGTDLWIATIDRVNKNFLAVRTVNGTIDTTTIISQPVYPAFPSTPFFKAHKFSYDGRLFRGMHYQETINGQNKSFFALYKFDNATGMISDYLKVQCAVAFSYVCEFSPDSRFLYSVEGYNIVQYDLTNWDANKISSSAIIISGSIKHHVSGIQPGPNGKLYAFSLSNSLSVIQAPNSKGTLCSFLSNAVDLNGRQNNGGAPYYPVFYYKFPELTVVATKNTSICTGDTLTLVCETKAPAIVWSTGDTGKTINVTQPGTYWAKATINGTTFIDSISVTEGNKFKVYLGTDTGFCGNFFHLLNAGTGAKSYLWNTGDTTVTKLVDKPGMYAVTIKDSNSCKDADTILITRLKEPVINVRKDTVACTIHLAVAPENGVNYLWSTGDTVNEIKVVEKGAYSLKASSQFCDIVKQVNVSETFNLELNIGTDTNYCGNFQRLLEAGNDKANYLWNTGDTTATKLVSQAGTYIVAKKYSNACKASDTITISQVKEPKITVTMDTINCNVVLSVIPQQSGVNYLWNTGEKSAEIRVEKRGNYTLKANTVHCSYMKQESVNELPKPEIALGNDTGICETSFITIGEDVKPGYKYLWNTGATSPQINVNKGGKYWLTVSQFGCKATDHITVWDSCDVQFFIPNAFSPTGDGLNEVFTVSGAYIREVSMQIFDRWGEKLYDVKGKSPAWDGTFKNVPCPEGVYIYMVKVTGRQHGKQATFYLRGNITLLR